ncbi:PREDICTED: craniofacial development protein 2-like, partial [Papilio polytes]|uniref:craniofacial development protein 2-like n=1 Tax=Papilio polytes TaxID=76194 RepID=UPI000675F053
MLKLKQNNPTELSKKQKQENPKQRLRNKFNISTINTRSMKSQESLLELELALETVNWDILGVCDVRREGEKTEERNNYILYHFNKKTGRYGVGFFVKKYLKNDIIEFRGISDRIAILNIKLSGFNQPVSIVQIYAPTEVTQKEIKDEFYNELNKVMSMLNKTVIIIGDFNSQIGKRNKNEDQVIGPYSTGKRNDNGHRLINFALENNLHIMNTYYKRKHNRKWTWISPDGRTRNEIDYILTNKPKIFFNVDVINKFNYNTDHRMLRGQIYLVEPKIRRTNHHNIKPIILPIKKDILHQLETNLETIKKPIDLQKKYDQLEKELKIANKICITSNEQKDKIGPEARNLIAQRKCLLENRKSNKEEIRKLSKEINLQ